MLSLQETFDKAASHLLKQMYCCENERMSLYRDDNGNKCAVGALIEDKFYSPELEGMGWGKVGELNNLANALRRSGIDMDNKDVVELLGTLQEIHDLSMPSEWKNQLKLNSNLFDLEFKF